jgi:hypothetical protein
MVDLYPSENFNAWYLLKIFFPLIFQLSFCICGHNLLFPTICKQSWFIYGTMLYYFNLLNENTIFYLIKTKQSCYYLILNLLNKNTIFYYIKTKQSCNFFIFFMKVFTSVSMLAYTSGFECQRPNILVSRSE